MKPKSHTDLMVISVIEKITAFVIVFAPFHAFLTYWLSRQIGYFTLIRLVDEILIFIIAIFAAYLTLKSNQLKKRILNSNLFRAIALYIILTVLLGLTALVSERVTATALGYALIVNLRFLVWFFAVYVVVTNSSWLARNWAKLVFIPLVFVVLFGLLQFFILPPDFLKIFGFNDTISYVATVPLNQDTSLMRIQSFLRGANPLGAYLSACVVILILWAKKTAHPYLIYLLAGASFIALILTFSRSAWLGLATSLITAGMIHFRYTIKKYLTIVITCCLILFALTLVSIQNAHFKNIILHVNDNTTAEITSNEGHANAARESIELIQKKPLFGYGPGTAGAASWYNYGHSIRNTESFHLQLILEVGIVGYLLFLCILIFVAIESWRGLNRSSLLLAIISTLVGGIVVNAFSYGWTDDTLAIVWWAIVAIGIAKAHSQVRS